MTSLAFLKLNLNTLTFMFMCLMLYKDDRSKQGLKRMLFNGTSQYNIYKFSIKVSFSSKDTFIF